MQYVTRKHQVGQYWVGRMARHHENSRGRLRAAVAGADQSEVSVVPALL
jgi:hypothetical protein